MLWRRTFRLMRRPSGCRGFVTPTACCGAPPALEAAQCSRCGAPSTPPTRREEWRLQGPPLRGSVACPAPSTRGVTLSTPCAATISLHIACCSATWSASRRREPGSTHRGSRHRVHLVEDRVQVPAPRLWSASRHPHQAEHNGHRHGAEERVGDQRGNMPSTVVTTTRRTARRRATPASRMASYGALPRPIASDGEGEPQEERERPSPLLCHVDSDFWTAGQGVSLHAARNALWTAGRTSSVQRRLTNGPSAMGPVQESCQTFLLPLISAIFFKP